MFNTFWKTTDEGCIDHLLYLLTFINNSFKDTVLGFEDMGWVRNDSCSRKAWVLKAESHIISYKKLLKKGEKEEEFS